MRYWRSTLFLVSVLVSGCAGVTVVQCAGQACGDNVEGLRFYRPQHYLLVTVVLDEAKNPVSNDFKIIVLPDRTKEYVIRQTSGFGTVSITPTLTDGWNLTSLATSVDTKISEFITALAGAGILGAAETNLLRIEQMPKLAEAGLYKLIWDSNGNLTIGSRIAIPNG